LLSAAALLLFALSLQTARTTPTDALPPLRKKTTHPAEEKNKQHSRRSKTDRGQLEQSTKAARKGRASEANSSRNNKKCWHATLSSTINTRSRQRPRRSIKHYRHLDAPRILLLPARS